MADRELRYLEGKEIRAIGGSGDADPLRLDGYAAVFNRSAKLPGFEERIKPGAFTRSIDATADIVCLWNHNSDLVLGRTTSGTLHLNQDERGLHFIVDLPNTQSARDYHESIRRGDVNGCSFGFMVDKDGQEWSEGKRDDGTYFVQRELTNFVRITDVSPVTYPCYDGTAIQARAVVEAPAELRSAVDTKNAALIVPPAVEKRPYSSVSEVPDSVPSSKRKQWMEVWNSAYSKALKDGKSAKDAESSAFAQANGVVKESKSMPSDKFEFRAVTGIDGYDIKPQDCPASWSDEIKTAYCDGYNGAMTKAIANKKHGNVAIAIAVSGGMMGIHEMLALPAESGSETDDKRIYADTDLDGDGDVSMGDARKKKIEDEKRIAETRDMNEDDDDEGDDDFDDLLDEEFDMAYKGRKHSDTGFHDSHTDDGNCEEGECSCQNRFAPSIGGYRGEILVGIEIRFADDFKFEARSGMTRTKRVAGKDLSAASFAYVGDKDKTETWKFPIFDASHTRNALARWGQDKGIPAGSKAGVYAKIKAAAKKFGIEVSEPDAAAARAEEQAMRLRLAEHMARVGPDFEVRVDQPRKQGGKFGTSKGERAASTGEHTAAATGHFNQAMQHDKDTQNEAATAHYRAADAHVDAAVAHSKKASDAPQKTDVAQAHSKVANDASYRCSM